MKLSKLAGIAGIAALFVVAGGQVLGQTPSTQAASAMPKNLSPESVQAADPYLWLEDRNGQKALAWVADQNKKTKAVLESDRRYETFRKEALAILTAQDRIPAPAFRGGGIDNFWQDQAHVRGIWRHAALESYRSKAPVWQTVIDIDALAKAENANWIWKGADCLEPEETRCLISLSDGGKDAVVVREFDTAAGKFVDGGFNLPEGKHRLAWLDKDTLLVATDFGPGTLTESGYPYIVKSLKRGQTLADAAEVFRGDKGDGGYGVSPDVMRNGAGDVLAVVIDRPLDTFRQETWQLLAGKPVKLNLPQRVTTRGAIGQGDKSELVFTVEEKWKIGAQDVAPGTLMAVELAKLRAAPEDPVAAPDKTSEYRVFTPTARQSIDDVAVLDNRIVAAIYDNVRGRVFCFTDHGEDGGWEAKPLDVPENVAVHLGSESRSTSRLFFTYEGFLTPATLNLTDPTGGTVDVIRQAPAKFDASKDVVEQFEATSKDGTKIPYFVVRPKAAPMNGSIPTMMFGYGGFQISEPPVYKPELGKIWLERGGAYVIANIRGGGEFGPEWHQAALKANRQRAFDDFAAVAADLATRKITSPKHLAIYGRSNGGVLTSVTLTQHPELIGGAVIESPLVDMLRYHELPPGASWMGEYGDPRIPEEAAWIAAYSGYQNVKPGMKYPPVYITTNTHDDRVHPGHARKFAARLQAMGYQALYYEETNGGHSNDADPLLNSARWARHYVYLARQLGLK
ncbi:MAG TPA: prolyl oligopeptidase family serine peptidase [Hyphomonadaceae bacterium]|nr:prolyl oligopeptidase family serine peptidase [Hyphomonadaceae bacterium]